MAHPTRRRFLEIAAMAAGGLALRTSLWPSVSRAQGAPDGLLLVCYFSGGWDQLLVLDPRDNTDPRFAGDAPYARGASGIHPAYELVQDAGVQAVLSAAPGGVQRRGNLTFGPAVPEALLQHAADLALVRGVNMGTLTHEVGRRYFLTGKFPRGLRASGSSLTTQVADALGSARDVPNLAVVTEAYNEGLAAYASAIGVRNSSDMLNVLRPLGTALPAASQSLLADFEAANAPCEQGLLDVQGQVSLYRASRQKARVMTQSGGYELFNFGSATPRAEVTELLTALDVKSTDFNTHKGRAAVAGQALARGYAQAVSVDLSGGNLDSHEQWGNTHATNLRVGLESLGRLISFLKSVQDGTSGRSIWQKTTLLVFSEFARTPLLNTRDGRDHHLSSSCLVAGPGVRGDTVLGATSDVQMAAQTVDPLTGALKDAAQGGVSVRPADVLATLLTSMGLPTGALGNQEPRLLRPLLR